MNTSTALTAYTTHLNSQNDSQQQQIYYNRFIPYYQQQLINTIDLQTTNNDFLDYSTQPFNIQTSSAVDLIKPNFYCSQSGTIAKNHPIATKTTTNNNNKSYKLKRAFTDETTINNNKISPLNRSISLQDQIFQNEANSNFDSNANNLGLNTVNSNFDPNSNLNSVNANNLHNSNSNFGVISNLKIKTELFDSSASTTTQLSNNSSCYSATTTSIGCPSTALNSSPSTNNERNTPFHNMDSNKMNINRPSSNLSSTIEQQQQSNNNNTNNGILSETNITLWQFLLELLTSNEHSDLIQWTNKDGEFKVNILI